MFFLNPIETPLPAGWERSERSKWAGVMHQPVKDGPCPGAGCLRSEMKCGPGRRVFGRGVNHAGRAGLR